MSLKQSTSPRGRLRARRHGTERRAVILLVVMALLALFTLMGLTLVLATAQARLTSINSARAQRSGTPPEQLLSRSVHDLIRGTTNKRSPIQAHSLGEDLYGAPLFIGQVSGTPTLLGSAAAGGAGQLLQMNYVKLASAGSLSPPYQLPNAHYVFTGLVITMRDGAAKNRSARIIADHVPGGVFTAYQLETTTFESFGSADGGSVTPAAGDSFVINGRPFSGTGFGYQAASFTNQIGIYDLTGDSVFGAGNAIYGGTTAAPVFTNHLDAVDPTPFLLTGAPLVSTSPQFLWPYALLPNHAHFTPQNATYASPIILPSLAPNPLFKPNLATPLSGPLPLGGGWYTDPGGPGAATFTGSATTPYVVLPGSAAGPGGANEPYDAVDYQNMFLAMHYFDTNVGPLPQGVVHPQVLTPVPSFHRPELVAYWSQYFPALAASPQLLLELRRKIMLRPDPADQQFIPLTQDLNGNGIYDFREPFTDVNGNAYYDLGEPFLDLNGNGSYTPGDLDFAGKRFNPITGPYCIYHNPQTNREVWVLENTNPNPLYAGPTGDWDVDNDGDGFADSIWMDLGYDPEAGPDGKLYKPMFAILCIDMDGKLNLNAHGNVAQVDPQRYVGTVTGPFTVAGGTNSGSLAVSSGSGRRFTFGDGYGPAEVNLAPLLGRVNALGGAITPVVLQYYQQLMQGTYLPSIGANPPRYIDGRNGEVDNPNLALAPGAVNPAFPGVVNPTSILGGAMPGKTLQFDPLTGFVNDPLNQAQEFSRHPFLMFNQPLQPPGLASYFFDYVNANFTPTAFTHVPTGYGSPYNLYGRGATLLDLRGQPYYAGTALLPFMGPVIDPVTAKITPDTVDDPYELNLMLSAQREGLVVNAGGALSRIDQPFMPDEVMRLLRIHDVDAQSLPSRLDDLIPLNPATMKPVSTALSLSTEAHRLAVTSDSWEIPAPGVTTTDTQVVTDLTAVTNSLTLSPYQQSVYNAMPTSLGGQSIVDLMRARIMIRNNWSAQQADLALFGSMAMGLGNNSIQPLIAPELIQGMRINVNRALGNGVDDNANGIADEQTEVAAEVLYFPLANGGNIAVSLDLNNDGVLPAADPYLLSDARSRQLLARHLYVTMMLLIDDLSLQAEVFEPAPTATTAYSGLSTAPSAPKPAQQVAYLVAQWAINVVDFRDPDSIMTPFEFDMSPFTDDNANPLDGTWDVDDVLMPSALTIDPWTNQTLATYTDKDETDPKNVIYRGLVWGCERPELLISETLAIHDRGTADTNQGANLPGGGADTFYGPAPADTTWDQVRRPRGSIIVELFNPNSPLAAPQGDMLQQSPNTPVPVTGGVNLTQYTVNPVTGGISPVWRLAVAYSPQGYDSYTKLAPASIQTTPLDPRVPVIPKPYIHRVAYFTPLDPTGMNPAALNAVTEIPPGRWFAPDPALVPPATPVVVPPNSYALVAPAVVDPRPNNPLPGVAACFIGARNNAADNTAGPNGKQNLYKTYLELNGLSAPNAVAMYNNWGAGATGGVGAAVLPFMATLPQQNIKNVVGLPLATLYLSGLGAPVPVATATNSVRFSLSEPELGYPFQTPLTSPYQFWDDGFYFLTGAGAPSKYPNVPFDNSNNTAGVTPNPNVSPDGTILNYTNIYLQRLANPLAPWDLTANPYITVDSLPLDLTSYTGESQNPPAGASTQPEPSYGGGGAVPVALALDARSRGEITSIAGVANAALDVPNVWTPASTRPNGWAVQSTVTAPLQYSTLGFLNQTYWISSTGASMGNLSNQATPTGWYAGFYSPLVSDVPAQQRLQNAATQVNYNGQPMPPNEYYGDPLLPFPWLAWNNRPFISQYELMLVPASSPSSLLSEFGLLGYNRVAYQTTAGIPMETWNKYTNNPYNPPSGTGPSSQTGSVLPQAIPLGPFDHLLNFYDSTLTNAAINTTRSATNPTPANFFRIFEYLNVPSPFTGTQSLLNPTAFSGVSSGYHWFHPPFNWLPQYREPGRINLNTIFDPVVFQGLMDDVNQWTAGVSPNNSWQTLWQGLVDTRRGFTDLSYSPLPVNSVTPVPFNGSMLPNLTLFRSPSLTNPNALPVVPTYFANPFRPEGAGVLEPPVSSPVAATQPNLQQPAGQSINTTLLRATAPAAYPGIQAAGTTALPLFSAGAFDKANQSATYTVLSGTSPARQAGRNAYFQYQAQQRLGNLVTNRSNVYAIWITVGYFEALPVLPSAANPDGYQLGAERGSDTGAQERHRAFYMFDRSIPMGFQRGEDLNVDNGILIERVIE